MSKSPQREVTKIIYKFRSFLLRRDDYLNQLRFKDDLSTRSPKPPALPRGLLDKLSDVNYHRRDARRQVIPPMVLYDSEQLSCIGQLEETTADVPKPGPIHNWDMHDPLDPAPKVT